MTRRTRRRAIVLTAVVALVSLLAALVATPGLAAPTGADNGAESDGHEPSHGRALFFASDGLRQDLVKKYAAQGVMPTMGTFSGRAPRRPGTGC